MTVQELIEQLQAHDLDAEVLIDDAAGSGSLVAPVVSTFQDGAVWIQTPSEADTVRESSKERLRVIRPEGGLRDEIGGSQ